jgi:hypothetical protein
MEVCVLLRLQANPKAASSSSHALQVVYSGSWHAGVSHLALQSTCIEENEQKNNNLLDKCFNKKTSPRREKFYAICFIHISLTDSENTGVFLTIPCAIHELS